MIPAPFNRPSVKCVENAFNDIKHNFAILVYSADLVASGLLCILMCRYILGLGFFSPPKVLIPL